MIKERILLLDGQTIQAISMAKALIKSGYKVSLFCDSELTYGFRTKYSDQKVICPDVTKNENLFKSFLIDFLKDKTIDAIIPMNDNSASFLSKHKSELLRYSKFVIPDYPVFLAGYDKNKLMKLCHQKGFPHPKTSDLSLSNYDNAADYVGFPSLIKPNLTSGGRGITLVRSKEEFLEKASQIIVEFGQCHLQEFIPEGGRQLKVQIFIDKNKKLIASSVMHKIRFYPEKGGSSCCNVTIKEDKLVNICFEVLKRIGWEGFADFDLIEDPRSKVIKIMEINPRVPACIKSSIVSGVNFAIIIANYTLDKELPKNIYYQPGKYLRYFGLEILWFVYSKNRLKTKPSWFKLLGKNIYYQEGSLDDLKPFIYGTFGGLLKQLNPSFRKKKSGMR